MTLNWIHLLLFSLRHGKLYFILLCFTLGFPLAGCYKPVILIHGVNSDGRSLSDLAGYIKVAHPGTIVTSLGLYNNLASFIPLHQQLPDFVKKLRPLMEQAQDGVHLICHSQGRPSLQIWSFLHDIFCVPAFQIIFDIFLQPSDFSPFHMKTRNSSLLHHQFMVSWRHHWKCFLRLSFKWIDIWVIF